MRLLLRADASAQIGTGHIMRCLALAQAVQDHGGQVWFVVAQCPEQFPEQLRDRLHQEGFTVVQLAVDAGTTADAQATIDHAQTLQVDSVAIDGYHFDAGYQQQLVQAGLRVLYFDDYGHGGHYSAHWVLNQNSSAQVDWYRDRDAATTVLLGTRYTLLRREFRAWRGWQRSHPTIARKILVTLGGSDPNNVTAQVLAALDQVNIDELEITVVVGGSNPHLSQLQQQIQRSRHQIQLLHNVTKMPDLITEADIAIAAGGTTTWELALLGLPSLVIALAENQVEITKTLDAQGIAQSLGWYSELTAPQMAEAMEELCRNKPRRQAMGQAGQALIDGEGCDRVLMHLQNQTIRLRPVRAQDCELIWQWANEPTTRQVSFRSEPIPWETHQAWFARQLQDQSHYFKLAIDRDDRPIAQVRLDRGTHPQNDRTAQISISLDPQYRRQGFGKQILQLALEDCWRSTHFTAINAWIKPDNLASIALFENAQFTKVGTEWIAGQLAVQYQLMGPGANAG
ncbi:MAG: UDP-2,4-diacetamido-2,4,6-trideoxy-beta-L-altropyranose hydrolase [Alkalinema sp. CACIAM 70d]|nr:MAG: UDP-2,4-diacetamido-2,4,6-trideoxy-beta-L-altropyranose hydrolase [Alkalinema sp. CACIAM 70d]